MIDKNIVKITLIRFTEVVNKKSIHHSRIEKFKYKVLKKNKMVKTDIYNLILKINRYHELETDEIGKIFVGAIATLPPKLIYTTDTKHKCRNREKAVMLHVRDAYNEILNHVKKDPDYNILDELKINSNINYTRIIKNNCPLERMVLDKGVDFNYEELGLKVFEGSKKYSNEKSQHAKESGELYNVFMEYHDILKSIKINE